LLLLGHHTYEISWYAEHRASSAPQICSGLPPPLPSSQSMRSYHSLSIFNMILPGASCRIEKIKLLDSIILECLDEVQFGLWSPAAGQATACVSRQKISRDRLAICCRDFGYVCSIYNDANANQFLFPFAVHCNNLLLLYPPRSCNRPVYHTQRINLSKSIYLPEQFLAPLTILILCRR